jgi:hypothetical protein
MDGKVISMRPFTSVDYCKKKQGGGMKCLYRPRLKLPMMLTLMPALAIQAPRNVSWALYMYGRYIFHHISDSRQ